MSAFKEVQFVAGVGWTAEVTAHRAMVRVDPAGDPLPSAVEALVAPARRRFMTLEWICEDALGWDVYVLACEDETAPTVRLALV